MSQPTVLRAATTADLQPMARLMAHSIRRLNQRHYSPRQIAAWAPQTTEESDEFRLQHRTVWVAEVADQLAGFAELHQQGYIDCFYCHPDFIRRGIGKKLYRRLEDSARQQGMQSLWVAASITAKPFFQAMGFTQAEAQWVRIQDVFLLNHKMIKSL